MTISVNTLTMASTGDDDKPFEDYDKFKEEALRLVKLSGKYPEFLALISDEQNRDGGPRDLPEDGGCTILHELCHWNAPMIDWEEGFLGSIKKVLEIWPDAASRVLPDEQELPLHTYLNSARAERAELEDDVVHTLVEAYPEALVMRRLPHLETPLVIMCRYANEYSEIDEPLIQYILDKDPSAAAIKDSKGRYPLHCLMLTDPIRTWRIAEAIYEAHKDAISTPDNDGNYPLHHAIDHRHCTCDDTIGWLCATYPEAARIRNNDGKTPMAIRIKRTRNEEEMERIPFMLYSSADLNKAYSDYGADDRHPTNEPLNLDASSSGLRWTDENHAAMDEDDDDIVRVNVVPTLTAGGSSAAYAICQDMTPQTYYCHKSVLGDDSRERCAMYFTAMLNSAFAEGSAPSINLHLHPDAVSVFPILLDSIYYGQCETSLETIAPCFNLAKYLRFRWGYDKAIADFHAMLCRSLQQDRPFEILSILLMQCFVNGLEKPMGAILGSHIRFIQKYYEDDKKWESEPDPYSYFNSYSIDLFLPMMKSLPIKWLPWNSKCIVSFVRQSREVDWDTFLELTSKEVLERIHHSSSIAILKCAMWLKRTGKDKKETRKELCALVDRCIEPIRCDHQALVKIACTDEGISSEAALKLLDELEKICSV